MRALEVGPGDEVITCSNTFVATVGAIVSAGARPVLADVGDNELMNVDTIAPLLSDRTKAVIPVYLRGRPLDIDAIIDVCRSRAVAVIEDCAQAIGTKRPFIIRCPFIGKKPGRAVRRTLCCPRLNVCPDKC